MKKLASFVLSISLMGTTGLALAQDTAPATGTAPAAQPATGTAPGGQPAMAMKGEHPRIREVRERLQRQRRRIWAAVKAGKMTKDEAKPLEEKVNSIREEMRADIKSNGKIELTEEQYSQLNSELNTNSDAIKDGQTEGGSNNAPASTGTSPNAPSTSSGAPATNP